MTRRIQTTSAESSRPLTVAELRTLSLASLGGALEFYDFIIFVFFIAVIGKLFFPASLPDWMRQTQAFGIFILSSLREALNSRSTIGTSSAVNRTASETAICDHSGR